MVRLRYVIPCLAIYFIVACKGVSKNIESRPMAINKEKKKEVVYQVFTRLFGNTNTTNKPWGTIEENGVGKFYDFTDKALQEIRDLGVTHIWYTGVPQHATITDYSKYGISADDPDVVKGRAGSPYAVKDYFNVNPDLAEKPEERLQEFESLIARTHRAGLRVLIDIVPNHVARNYEGLSNPDGIRDFGTGDDTSTSYAVNNNYYYNPGESFQIPHWLDGYQPLGGEDHPLADGEFDEKPAKWTGNGSRLSQPDMNDWYETVKINYGIHPDGIHDFEALPEGFEHKDYIAHFEFWRGKQVPDSWVKFKDIVLYWLDKGVDGFRFDMAEMVPVEFWSYLNSTIKTENPDAFLLAEVYQPHLYRDYISKGKIDYLYDKVQLYDTIKNIIRGYGKTDHIPQIQEDLRDIEPHMVHFLENHDEQRIASPEYAGTAEKGKPAMVVSATISSSPTLVYFGQELGERGAENAGYGKPSRTSIFDYIGVPAYQRWVNDKKFDGGRSSVAEKNLRDFYKKLLNFTINSTALVGDYMDIHTYNRAKTIHYTDRVLSFARWGGNEKLIIVANFDAEKSYEFELKIPKELIDSWELEKESYSLTDQLSEAYTTVLKLENKEGTIPIKLRPLESFILKLK